MTLELTIVFLSGLFLIALLYSSVGHGGASGYLAWLALFGFAPAVIKPAALVMNLAISLIAAVQFTRAGFNRPKILWPLIIASIPMAFLGSLVTIDPGLYKKVLGFVLVITVLRFTGIFSTVRTKGQIQPKRIFLLLTGASIGFLSGLIGIGGGIILSPLLLIFHWTEVKETAAISAIFIFVNSAAGLAGVSWNGAVIHSDTLSWLSIIILGGFLGSYIGSKKLRSKELKYVLASVLVVAAFKLIFV